MEIECSFPCAYCLQLNTLLVDGTAGRHQEIIEDCQVCCRPNLLVVTVESGEKSATIEVRIP